MSIWRKRRDHTDYMRLWYKNPTATELDIIVTYDGVIAEAVQTRVRNKSKAVPPPSIITTDGCLYTLERRHPFLLPFEFSQRTIDDASDTWTRIPAGLASHDAEVILMCNAQVTLSMDYMEPYLYCYKAESVDAIFKHDPMIFLFHGWALYRRLL